MVGNSHAHNGAELGTDLLKAGVTELSDELLTISVDRPHPPVHSEEKHSTSQLCNEPHPSPSSCRESQSSPLSPDLSKPCLSDHSPVPTEVSTSNQQPLPLHEPHSQISNFEPRPPTNPGDERIITTKDQPILIPSNQLIFELD